MENSVSADEGKEERVKERGERRELCSQSKKSTENDEEGEKGVRSG